MSGVRQSFVYCREKDGFDTGIASKDAWIAPPPGSFFSATHTRSVTKVYTEGSKYWDTVAYGQLSGSWEWTFTMDYDYLEPFALAFDKVSISGDTFTFTKENNLRVPSFCVRGKILNDITNSRWNDAGEDETYTLTGCVVKTIRFSKSAGASQVSVSMSGFYANEYMVLDDLDATDYQDYDGHLVEFSCMFIGNDYMADTESLSVGIENSASAIYTTCSPIASNFAESQTSFTFGMMAYANNPDRYWTRLYGGGVKATETKGYYYPHHKNMAPVPQIDLKSFNTDAITYDSDTGKASADFTTALGNATRTATISLVKTVIKSLTRQKGDGSKLQDQINSTDVQKVQLVVKTPYYSGVSSRDGMWASDTAKHKVANATSAKQNVLVEEES